MAKGSTHVVLGAGGATGLQCVLRLLEIGANVKAVVRDPEKYKSVFPEDDRLAVVAGDVTSVNSLEGCMAGADGGVIFAAAGNQGVSPKEVDNEGVANVAAVAKKMQIEPVVLVSSALVTKKNKYRPIRLILNNLVRSGLMDEKLIGEAKLRGSGVTYTVIRPGRLTNDATKDGCKFVLGQGDTGMTGAISRYHLAVVCCSALIDPSARNRTFELCAESPKEPTTVDKELEGLFSSLKPGMFD
eukprot:evm.model.scf_1429.3 EVM.evm.TU.scf_1429.3   scf_1429:10204-14847(+)